MSGSVRAVSPATMVAEGHGGLRRLLFLAWESPYPARGGASLRTFGLLRELSRFCSIHLLVVSREALDHDQIAELSNYADQITQVPLADSRRSGLVRVLLRMLGDRVPYHCAVLRETFRGAHLSHLRDYDGAVYANFGHWGTLLASPSPQWVLDQQNADVQFWEAYIAYSRGLRKLAAFINWRLASHHFPSVYRNVGRIICVSETDRQLTLQIAPQALVDVVENGVDCSYLTPGARLDSHLPRLLFTGTSAARNVKALADFVDEVYPRIRAQRPGAELCVAGNFAARAQERFADVDGLWFTGAVPDLRPYFDPNDVFIAPFNETHGSKLKVAEAMAMGMAIVATPEGAQGMPVMNGCNAIIANGVDEFADRCCELLSDEALRRRLGRQARQTALERLDWPVLGERLRQMIDEVQLRERAIR